MVCKFNSKCIPMSDNIFVRYETQHNTCQSLNQVIHVLHTYFIQTMKYITYSGPKISSTVLVSIIKCKKFVAFKYSLMARILSNNSG